MFEYQSKKNPYHNDDLLQKLFNRITPTEKERTFHSYIFKFKDNLSKCYNSNPYFCENYGYKNESFGGRSHSRTKSMRKKEILFKKGRPTINSVARVSMPTITTNKQFTINNDKDSGGTGKETERSITKSIRSKVLSMKSSSMPDIFQSPKSKKNEKESPEGNWFDNLDEKNPFLLLFKKKLSPKNIPSVEPSENDSRSSFSRIFPRKNEPEENKNKIQFLDLLAREVKKKTELQALSYDSKFRVKKFNFLLEKCSDSIEKGRVIDSKIDKEAKSFDDKVFYVKSLKKKVTNFELKKMEDTLKVRKKNKYDLLYDKSIETTKKRANLNISDNLAYENRKEYEKLFKNPEKNDPYEIFLRELNEINKKILKKKEVEEGEITQIENILEDTIKDKDILKIKIEEQAKKYIKARKNEGSGKYFPLLNEIFTEKHIKKEEYPSIKHLSFDAISREVFERLSKKYPLKKSKECKI